MLSLRIFLAVLITGVFCSCGKKIEDSQAKNDVRPSIPEETIDVNFERAFNNETVFCKGGLYCPGYLAKFIIFDGKKKLECPSVLISSDRVLTSASCIPKHLRVSNMGLMKKAFVSFVNYKKSYNIEALKIESLSYSRYIDPSLWKNDFAIIKLRQKSYRRTVYLNSLGTQNLKQVSKWYLKDNKFVRSSCDILYNTYVNPFADSGKRSFLLMGDCHDDEVGQKGSVILGGRYSLVAVESIQVRRFLVNNLKSKGLLTEEIKPYTLSYISNIACIPSIFKKGFIESEQCEQLKTIYELDRKRKEVRSMRKPHKENIKKLMEELNKSEKYFYWNFDFKKSYGRYGYKLYMKKPKCFFSIKSWIQEFKKGRKILSTAHISVKRKNYHLVTKFNKFLYPVSVILEDGVKDFKVKFSPSNAYFRNITDVKLKKFTDDYTYSILFKDISGC
ncbi:MAG: hypothetical protein N4A33_01350 [Bacteriovoracaceae bacterium]|jgi:hypothetical protein|nr:hypothetical protein [Bacteriovoracaceae bacterium]